MKTLRLIVGSFVVYFAVAILHACGPTPAHMASTTGSAGHAGSAAAGGMGGAASTMASAGGNSGGHGGAVGTGGMMNPVGDADAEESGSRIKAKRIVGADGSKQFEGWYDTNLKVECSYLMMSDGKLHCIPEYAATIGFSDSACTMPVIGLIIQGCPPPPIAGYISSTLMCGYSYAARTVGPPVSQSMYYSNFGGPCVSSPISSPFTVYATGAELPPSMFVAATVVQDP